MDRLSSCLLLVVLALLGSVRADDTSDNFFELKIRPVLVNECLPCHGGKKTSSGFKVDSREALLKLLEATRHKPQIEPVSAPTPG